MPGAEDRGIGEEKGTFFEEESESFRAALMDLRRFGVRFLWGEVLEGTQGHRVIEPPNTQKQWAAAVLPRDVRMLLPAQLVLVGQQCGC